MNDNVKGLILKQQDYRENAVLLTVLTKEYGRIAFVAAGARKMTSKNAGSIMPFTLADFSFDYKEGKTIFRMKTARTVNLFRFVHENLNASLCASVIAETADLMTVEGSQPEFCEYVYDSVETSWRMLNEKKRADLILCLFLSDLLKESGIGPVVDECVLCGRKNAAVISVSDGGFLCSECADRAGLSYQTINRLRQFRMICRADFENYDALAGNIQTAADDAEILVRFFDRHAGIEIRSFALFQRLFTIDLSS